MPTDVSEDPVTPVPKLEESNTLVPAILNVYPAPTLISPPTLNFDCGDCKPMPTFPENSAIPTVPSASTLKDGIPEISLTEKIVPVVTAFDTENS